jgi:hypothetical protein
MGPEGISEFQNRQQVAAASEYLSILTRDEAELLSVFDQALEVIATHRGEHEDANVPGQSDNVVSTTPEPGR